MPNLELNKIAAAVLTAGLIAMVAGTVARGIYGDKEHGHATEEKRGYKIEVAEEQTGSAPAATQEEAPMDIAALMASADAERGKKIATTKCTSCHTFEKGEPAKVGPNLYGILGNKYAHMEGFNYSNAFKALNGGWDYDNLFKFIHKPQKFVPQTKMTFSGIKKPEEIADVVAFLRSLSDQPLPLPEKK